MTIHVPFMPLDGHLPVVMVLQL